MKGLFHFFMFWLTVSNKYDRLKSSPDRQNSVSLGLTGIIMSIVGVLTAVGLAYLALLCFKAENLTVLIAFPVGILCALSAVVCFFQLLVASIFYASYQLRLNKRPIGIIALVISLLLLIGAIVGIIVVLTSL